MLVETVSAQHNSVEFTAQRPESEERRYTCFLCLTAQDTSEVGVYLIGINSVRESIHKIHGIDATITRNGALITVTFTKNYIYSDGFVIIPRNRT